MTAKDTHEYVVILTKFFRISKAEIARMAGIERTNLSKWINHPDDTYMPPERIAKLEKAIMTIAYGITAITKSI